MDLSTLLLPGAQNLATAMLSDAWTATRDAVARRWGRGDHAATKQAAAELDDSRTQALALFPASAGVDAVVPAAADPALLQAFLAGYLAALARTDPGRLPALFSLTAQPGQQAAAAAARNVNYGEVERLVQVDAESIDKLVQIDGDVQGGFHM
ncbi:hypothetical protein Caci_2499 [Catenulispora acidiphila DSM 44928]|uniref:Uncharacterized protein n=2 Tax=Catenulispora TaxID=414878 RepID=C7PXG4_CATAD|nr:hypothetical protein Caci_2499 [Catenulispora acidiphila DSM 44928]